MRLFLDANLSPHLAAALAALCTPQGVPVVHKRDLFPDNTRDVDWIQKLGNEGDWVVISHDRFHKNPMEKEALRKAGLTVFLLQRAWSERQHWDKAVALIRWTPRILEQADLVAGGAVFEVPYRFSGKGRFRQITI